MSVIDSYKHEIVGYFGRLPVYRALEDIDDEFSSTASQLIIGGGGGEHPALVIKDPTEAVARFLSSELYAEYHINPDLEKDLNLWRDIINENIHWDKDALQFYKWDISTYKGFYDMCSSPFLLNPYYEDSEMQIEEWLMLGIGEFIFYSLPELAHGLISKLENPYKNFSEIKYNNILLVPRNFPVDANGGNAFSFSLNNCAKSSSTP